jgi:hypothetical protein
MGEPFGDEPVVVGLGDSRAVLAEREIPTSQGHDGLPAWLMQAV